MSTKIKSESIYSLGVTLLLTEEEVRALSVLPSYGTDSFLECFYTKLGKHYLSPHEKGLRSLFETIKKELPKHLKKADEVRKIINS